MIITEINGGLGNQLFQYAAARGIADRIPGNRIYLERSACREASSRPFELAHLQLPARVIPGLPGRLLRLLPRRVLRRFGITLLREVQFDFNPAVLTVQPPVYLKGYWQSERYFPHLRDTLKREFQPAFTLSPDFLAAREAIRRQPAVSIHIRRGDYVTEPETNRIHGVLPAEYYLTALQAATAAIPGLHGFVFSDDPAWVAAELTFSLPVTFVAVRSEHAAIEELHLMAACVHHVIANSTFSWWGAWLGETERSVILAPEPWFKTPEFDTTHLIPACWRKIHCTLA